MKKIWTYGRIMCLMLLTAVLLAGCSDSQEPESPQPDILSRFNTEGKSWLTLQMPLGSRTMTRATDFADGSSDEYKVRNAHVLIFAGADEATATFASAYEVMPSLASSTNDQITTTATVTISDDNINAGDKLFVLVVLNNNATAITTNAFPATNVTFANANGLPLTLEGGVSTFSALDHVTVSLQRDGNGYFMMTNARLADDYSTTAGLFTLVGMDASFFFHSEEESLSHPAAHINVERLSAKATVEDELTNHYVLGNEYATFTSDDLRFALDNYNVSSFLCRHLSAIGYERMVESRAIETQVPLCYRTYWAEDINYDGASGLTYHNQANRNNIAWNALGSATPQYCAENTFDVANMKDNCTTSVLVRLQLNNGNDFYTTSVTGSDIVFQTPDNELTEQGTSASSSFCRTRSVKVTYNGTNYATIDEYLRQWLMETNKAFRDWVNDYAAGEAKHVAITLTNDAATGTATVSNVTQTARTSGDGVTAFASLNLVNYIANNIALKFYENGYCYYRVLIRHFDDEQTPWSSTASMTDNTTATVYGGDAESYLGRYGVVRNNWYNISINSVTHIGSPIIPPLTTNADDKVEQLLNATLRISGWEKHEQNL